MKFANVTRSLRAEERIGGFSVHTLAGEWVPLIYRTDIDPGDGATVLLHTGGKLVFGPLTIQR